MRGELYDLRIGAQWAADCIGRRLKGEIERSLAWEGELGVGGAEFFLASLAGLRRWVTRIFFSDLESFIEERSSRLRLDEFLLFQRSFSRFGFLFQFDTSGREVFCVSLFPFFVEYFFFLFYSLWFITQNFLARLSVIYGSRIGGIGQKSPKFLFHLIPIVILVAVGEVQDVIILVLVITLLLN